MSRERIVIGAAGVALGLFGVFRLLTQISAYNLTVLFCWLIGALVIHDGLLSPLVIGIGAGLKRFVPDRARGYLQFGLIAGGLVTVIAIPMIYRQDSQPVVKAILQQHFGANLATLLAIVAGLALMLYVARVLRDRQAASATNERPPEDHTESTE
jgi:hypothetical protein